MAEVLGQGAYGIVYLGKWRNQDVAIKKISGTQVQQELINEFAKEAMLMRYSIKIGAHCSSELRSHGKS